MALRPAAAAPYAAPSYLARPRGSLADHDWLGVHVRVGRIVQRADSLVALREAARAGFSVVALPCYLGDPDPGLRRVAPPDRRDGGVALAARPPEPSAAWRASGSSSTPSPRPSPRRRPLVEGRAA